MCAGIAPGEGHIRACIQAHIERTLRRLLVKAVEGGMGLLGVKGTSSTLPQATYGNISDCMRPHLGEAQRPMCRGQRSRSLLRPPAISSTQRERRRLSRWTAGDGAGASNQAALTSMACTSIALGSDATRAEIDRR